LPKTQFDFPILDEHLVFVKEYDRDAGHIGGLAHLVDESL
jgi:hypothetical protein